MPVRDELGRDERQHGAGAADLDRVAPAGHRIDHIEPLDPVQVRRGRREAHHGRQPQPVINPCGVSSATTRPSSTTATRSQSCSASSMKCVTSTTVVPSWRISRIRSHVTRRA